MLFLRSLFFTVVIPGTVTVYIPFLIVTRWSPGMPVGWGAQQYLSVVPIAIGAAVLLHCIWLSYSIGRGTLAPVDAPRHLVVRGLYRYGRNPMYWGVLTILLGESLFFESITILWYAAGFLVVFHVFVVLYGNRSCADSSGNLTDSIANSRPLAAWEALRSRLTMATILG